MYNQVSKKYKEVSTNLFYEHLWLVGEWTRHSRHLERGEEMKVIAKEWRIINKTHIYKGNDEHATTNTTHFKNSRT